MDGVHMKKQIIVITNFASSIPNIPNLITVTLQQFLTNTYTNSYVLVDRFDISTKEIMLVKNRCQETGFNPFLDGSYMDISYVFIQDWSCENEEEGYKKAISEAIQYLEEAETQRKLYQLEDSKNISVTFKIA